MTPADEILAHALARPPLLGATRLICLDGPSGSGKSTIAGAIASASGAAILHTDDLCPGWDGIPALPPILRTILEPLAAGEPGRHPRYDWILARQVEDLVMPPAALVIVEGVAAGARSLAQWTSTLAWIDADALVRKERAIERDGEYFLDFWVPWARAEAAFFERDQVRERADLRYSTS